MSRFRYGHATHPDWRMATDLVVAQLACQVADASRMGWSGGGNLGIVYATAAFGDDLDGLVALLRERTGIAHWVGAVGHGVCATGVEYDEDPALAVMLADLPDDGFQVISGRHPPPPVDERTSDGSLKAHTALIHADPGSPELTELIADMSSRTASGYLFGGVVAGAFSQVADEVFSGGLSGAAFSSQVRLLSRVTQGCAPLAGEHVISECSAHFICQLDGRPALDVMLDDLGVKMPAGQSNDGEAILRALPAERLRPGLLVGLASGDRGRGIGFGDFLVRNVVGIDPQNRLLAVSDVPREGDRAVFCTRDREAARSDLVRICTELRSEAEEDGLEIRGALYHSCVARGAHLFGGPGAELSIIRHNLGDLPLIGVYANGEIARDRIYGYTGVLTLFV